MTTPCDAVTEAVVLGEGLEAHAAHVETCEMCRATIATAAQLSATSSARDPALGFAARMTVGAQNRFDTRRRRRIVGGIGGAVAAAALGVFVVTRAPANEQASQPAVMAVDHHGEQKDPPAVDDPAADAAALATLVRLSDTDHNRHLSARWGKIERPLAPYRAVLKGSQ
jgi:anti-sigma-K factor RskA